MRKISTEPYESAAQWKIPLRRSAVNIPTTFKIRKKLKIRNYYANLNRMFITSGEDYDIPFCYVEIITKIDKIVKN